MNKDIKLTIDFWNEPSNSEGFAYIQRKNYRYGIGQKIYGTSTITKYGTFYAVSPVNAQSDIFYILNRENYTSDWGTPYYQEGTTNIFFSCRAEYRYFDSGNFAIFFPYVIVQDTIKNKISSLLANEIIYFNYTFDS